MTRIGSLCSGIAGLDMATEAVTGGTVAWHAEVDPHASQVLARWYPGVPNVWDFTMSADRPTLFDLSDWSSVEPVDVLTAGYPCQPFSTAGRRKGTDDHRHLWPFVADAVRALRPRLILLENVRGHLSLGFGDVLGDLAEAGYDAEWCCIRASDVGAPHRRERVFVAAWPAADTDSVAREASIAGSGRPGEVERPEPQQRTERLPSGPVQWGRYEPAIRRWEHILGRPAPHPVDDRRRLEPAFVEWMMGYPEGWCSWLPRSKALKALGNAVVPQQAVYAYSLLLGEPRMSVAVSA